MREGIKLYFSFLTSSKKLVHAADAYTKRCPVLSHMVCKKYANIRSASIARILLIIISALTLKSCVTLEQARLGKSKVELTQGDLSRLNGDYDIRSPNNSQYLLSWVLAHSECCSKDTSGTLNDRVAIQVLTDNKIKVTVIEDYKKVKTKTLKGSLNDGYFECSVSYVSPFWLLINGYTRQKLRIGLLPDGNLVADTAHETLGLLVLVPFTGERYAKYNLEFARKESGN